MSTPLIGTSVTSVATVPQRRRHSKPPGVSSRSRSPRSNRGLPSLESRRPSLESRPRPSNGPPPRSLMSRRSSHRGGGTPHCDGGGGGPPLPPPPPRGGPSLNLSLIHISEPTRRS
eukprot:7146798-Prymnesium_polylepis.1